MSADSLLHFWWRVEAPALHIDLPGTIGLPLEDVHLFASPSRCLPALLERHGILEA